MVGDGFIFVDRDFPTSEKKLFKSRQNSRPMSQTLRKILCRATHRTKVQKQDEIENGTIEFQVRRRLSEVVLRICLNFNIFFVPVNDNLLT